MLLIKTKFFAQISLKQLVFIFIIFSSIYVFQIFAQGKNDLETYRLKGKPRTVEEYKITYTNSGKTEINKKLSRILYFNSEGKLIESLYFVFNGNESYYQRNVSYFDEMSRAIHTESYQSSKDKTDSIFLPDIEETGIKKLNPNSKERLISKSVRKLDKRGKIIEVSTYDGTGEILSKYIYGYNEKGEEIIIGVENGIVVYESKTISNKTGWKTEDIQYEKTKPVYKSNYDYDKKGNIVKLEQFRLKMAPDGTDTIEEIDARSSEKVNGNKKRYELMFFNELGFPTIKFLRCYENRLEQRSVSYKYENEAKSKWVFYYETKTKYTFDKQGNWIKSATSKKEKLHGYFVESFGKERIISYF